MKKAIVLFMFTAISHLSSAQQLPEPNYDEEKVPTFIVTNPLETFDGEKVTNVNDWERKRRPELLDFFTQNVYGEVPGDLTMASYDVVEQSNDAIAGKAIRKQIKLTFERGT